MKLKAEPAPPKKVSKTEEKIVSKPETQLVYKSVS